MPAVASVGLTEAKAAEGGDEIQVHVNDMRGWLSARTYAETVAWSKVIVEEESDRILGAHIVGHAGEELIHIFALAMRHGITAASSPTISTVSRHSRRTSRTCSARPGDA